MVKNRRRLYGRGHSLGRVSAHHLRGPVAKEMDTPRAGITWEHTFHLIAGMGPAASDPTTQRSGGWPRCWKTCRNRPRNSFPQSVPAQAEATAGAVWAKQAAASEADRLRRICGLASPPPARPATAGRRAIVESGPWRDYSGVRASPASLDHTREGRVGPPPMPEQEGATNACLISGRHCGGPSKERRLCAAAPRVDRLVFYSPPQPCLALGLLALTATPAWAQFGLSQQVGGVWVDADGVLRNREVDETNRVRAARGAAPSRAVRPPATRAANGFAPPAGRSDRPAPQDGRTLERRNEIPGRPAADPIRLRLSRTGRYRAGRTGRRLEAQRRRRSGRRDDRPAGDVARRPAGRAAQCRRHQADRHQLLDRSDRRGNRPRATTRGPAEAGPR